MAPFAYDLKNVLVSIDNISLKFDDKVILKPITMQVRDIVRTGVCQGQVIGILGPSGIGKCLAKGTSVLMFDGTLKKVEDVRIGDALMGPDSKPRNVLDLGHGYDHNMYRIQPTKGESFTVNSPHILALHLGKSKRSKAKYVEVSVADYLGKSRTFKARTRLYRVGIDFPEQEVPVDPYFFGLWLGDGSSDSTAITNQDPEVFEAVEAFALAVGAESHRVDPKNRCSRISVHNNYSKKPGTVLKALRLTGALNNKHVPLKYKANSRDVRLQLLAGIIDSDGGIAGANCYEVSSKHKHLADDYCYIARSLGLAAYCKSAFKKCQTGKGGIYHRVTISGHVDEIPVRIARKIAKPRKQIKDVLRTGFTVHNEWYGEYFGFELDGDGLFLLSDFTVTHNTQFSRILAGLQKPTTGAVTVEVDLPGGGVAQKTVGAGLVGMVAQDYPLFKHRTIEGNLLVALEHTKASKKDRLLKVYEYLNRFGLADKARLYPAQLSGGQKQRVSIIQELLSSEHFLIMDEPFTGLDPINKDLACELILQVSHLDEKNTLFIVAHDIASLVTVSDQLWLFGRDRDAAGNPVPGAYIKKQYNLVDLGFAWHEGISATREFSEFCNAVKEEFRFL